MKIISYTPLHYGADYLADAIRSVYDVVNEVWILYTPTGSHGHRTSAVCPDTRADLQTIAERAAGHKLRWFEGEWPYEGAQRDTIFKLAPDADVVLALDADELWLEPQKAIDQALAGEARSWRVPMVHFWRSFYRAVINDHAYPHRVIIPKRANGEAYCDTRPIAHMGYAQRSPLVEYKQQTHGHKAEWRPEWFTTKWQTNSLIDVHPTCVDYWFPQPVDPWAYLPAWMQFHEYAGLEVIP